MPEPQFFVVPPHRLDVEDLGLGQELARRRREKAREQPTYDVELRGRDRLSVKPSPFVRQALAKANRLKLVETLHNQPAGHFALNALDWRLLDRLMAGDTAQAAADNLGGTVARVREHVGLIKVKLGVRTMPAVLELARRLPRGEVTK